MVAEQFDNDIRKLVRARPFQPFIVVMDDGRMLYVDKPSVAFNNGGAGLVDSAGEIQLIECEHVRELRLAHEELAK